MYRSITSLTALLLVFMLACGETEDSGSAPPVSGDTTLTDTVTDTVTGADTTPETGVIDIVEGDLVDTLDAVMEVDPGDGLVEDAAISDTLPMDTSDQSESPSEIAEEMIWPTDVPIPDIPIGEGACTNEADLLILSQPNIETAVSDCVMPCIMESDVAACSTDCIKDATGLSDACSACFGETVQCTMDNCMMQCMNPSSDSCNTCRIEQCGASFEECAGVPMQM